MYELNIRLVLHDVYVFMVVYCMCVCVCVCVCVYTRMRTHMLTCVGHSQLIITKKIINTCTVYYILTDNIEDVDPPKRGTCSLLLFL